MERGTRTVEVSTLDELRAAIADLAVGTAHVLTPIPLRARAYINGRGIRITAATDAFHQMRESED